MLFIVFLFWSQYKQNLKHMEYGGFHHIGILYCRRQLSSECLFSKIEENSTKK